MDDTPLNRRIAERFEIDQAILAARGVERDEDIDDEYVDDEAATQDDWD